jgi:hypothetical protein
LALFGSKLFTDTGKLSTAISTGVLEDPNEMTFTFPMEAACTTGVLLTRNNVANIRARFT